MNVIDLTKKLIRIKSFSGEEQEIMDFVAKWGKKEGFSVILQKTQGIHNVLLSVGTDPKTTVFTTHLDTVAFYETSWKKTHPLKPLETKNYLYGLGSNDAKGVAASMLFAAKKYSNNAAPSGRIIVALVSEEETTGNGSAVLVPFAKKKFGLDTKNTLVVVGEPTGLDRFSIGNKGNAFVQLTFSGKSSHGSRPQEGHNAARDAALCISELTRFEKDLNKKYADTLFTNTVSVTGLESNISVKENTIQIKSPNTIPDFAKVTLDCRLVSTLCDNNFKLFYTKLEKFLKKFKNFPKTPQITYLHPPIPGHMISKTHPAISVFSQAVEKITAVKPQEIAVSGANDAAFWGSAGFTTINEYGPGSARENHTADEKMNLTQLRAAPDVYLSIAQEWFSTK